MAAVDIKMLGDVALQRKFNALPDALEKKILRSAMRKAMKVVQAKAKTLVSVDRGALKRSLKVRARKFRSRHKFGVMVVTGTPEELGIPANARGCYPMSVEAGSEKQAAQPYLRPALRGQKELLFGMIREEVGRRVVQEAKQA